jgi:hypothetical protein
MEPLADVITLLRPRAVGTKVIQGAGRWAVRRSRMDFAGFGLVLIGECWLAVDGYKPVRLALALQLSCFEVGTLSGGLVSSAPE